MNTVELDNVRKSYSRNEVLCGVSFTVQRGEIFSLLGQNGAGKTTTLDIIEGLQSEFSGEVAVFGKSIRVHAQKIKSQIGVQLQSTALISDLSALEQIKMFAHLYRVRLTTAQALDFLARFQLVDKANSKPDKMSGGEKQRLTLALALVNSPDLLILDEPTAGLDVQSRLLLWQNIKEWHTPERSIILTTHHIEEAEKLADRVGILHGGRLVALDSPQALINQLNAEVSIVVDSELPELLIKALSAEKITASSHDTRIYTREPNPTIVELVTHAERLGVKIRNMRINYPTLEDVFIARTGTTIPSQL